MFHNKLNNNETGWQTLNKLTGYLGVPFTLFGSLIEIPTNNKELSIEEYENDSIKQINDEMDSLRFQKISTFLGYIEAALGKSNVNVKELANYFQPREVIELYRVLSDCKPQKLLFGLDYYLELRELTPLIKKDIFPKLFHFISIMGDREFGIEKENHGMGYHFHYVKEKKHKRTNVLFTFDKRCIEENKITPPLFWEYHGSGINADPNSFGENRRRAIYQTVKGSFSKLEKNNLEIKNFKIPDASAKRLYPFTEVLEKKKEIMVGQTYYRKIR